MTIVPDVSRSNVVLIVSQPFLLEGFAQAQVIGSSPIESEESVKQAEGGGTLAHAHRSKLQKISFLSRATKIRTCLTPWVLAGY